MVTSEIEVEGRAMRYSVSNNVDAYGPAGPGSPPIWAINIHGYLAGGEMYTRESLRVAKQLHWRVVNPSLPGFGGSDPLEWEHISIPTLSRQIEAVREHLGIGPVVLLGHSMGGAVAVDYAVRHQRRTLGIIYRDGISTPSWKRRAGLVPTLLHGIAPDVAPIADMAAAIVLDLPDLLAGRLLRTMRSVIPDVRRNVRTIAHSVPVGSMLMTIDQREQVAKLADRHVPLLAEWGCFDRLTDAENAAEFARCADTEIQWVPGGHSWMLARPSGQADILTRVRSGQAFVAQVEARWRRLVAAERRLHAVAS
jgi:pimeloyl-ACP methyl ester carboxylesterase